MEATESTGTTTSESSGVVEATTTESSSAPVTTSSSQSSSSSSAPVITEASAAPVYTPNYKFKVMDKEMEIPEKFRAIIKDADTEKEAREIFEKAYGLDKVKESRDGIRGEYTKYKEQTEPTVRAIGQASQLYQQSQAALESGNTRAAVFKGLEAFKTLGVSKTYLQKLVFEDLKLEELPPEQKASYNREHELEKQTQMLAQEREQMQSEFQNYRVQQRTSELQQVISRPDIASLVQAFDSRNGQGSFYNEVVLRGQWYAQTYQKDMAPDQVVSEIIQKYGLQAQASPTPQAVAPTQAIAPKQDVPVIPAIKGGTQSPAGRAIRSVDDIKKVRFEKYGY